LTLLLPRTPPLEGMDFVTPPKHSRRNLSTARPQAAARMWIKLAGLSTDQRTYPQVLWINPPSCGQFSGWRRVARRGLWINLWIRGVKSVDKPVDNSVENSSLWISRDLSTFHPQESATYPQIRPQPRGRVFGLGKAETCGCPHIHRPYYYYYSNTLMV
jgi:hypothetical protein